MTEGTRAGTYVLQPAGYKAFVPNGLPPVPPICFDGPLQALVSRADRALGRLDGVTTILPNPDLFVAIFVRHESVLSSQIEGTQSTLEDVLEYEISPGTGRGKDVEEVVNYVRAMNRGLERLSTLPLSLRLIREIHEELMQGVRGGDKTPGEFRKTQNWIGGARASLKGATFVPPPPYEMNIALDNLERFLHQTEDFPALIHCGMAHAQFETIHPFLDGNGRVGRLLITLLLCEQKILARPLLYLSYYLKLHRSEYYDRLMAVRLNGDWEGWLRFFIKGVAEVSEFATDTARKVIAMREDHRARYRSNASMLMLLDYLLDHPLLTINAAKDALNVSYPTASVLIDKLKTAGLLREITGNARNKRYRYQPYLDLFEEPPLVPAAVVATEVTQA